MKGTDLAPEGTVFVCGACGKCARSRYGCDAAGVSTVIDPGWDSSCMWWAVLCHEVSVRADGKWDAVEAGEQVYVDALEYRP